MHIYVYICVYVCIQVCLYVCKYIFMYARTYVCMYVCVYLCMHVCMPVFWFFSSYSSRERLMIRGKMASRLSGHGRYEYFLIVLFIIVLSLIVLFSRRIIYPPPFAAPFYSERDFLHVFDSNQRKKIRRNNLWSGGLLASSIRRLMRIATLLPS